MIHGEPSWGYLYRKMVNPLVQAGKRVLVPDLPGFGRSDKLSKRDGYTYEKYVNWMSDWLLKVDLTKITLFGQDWGGLIGLRLVTAFPERFSKVVAANTFLPTGDHDPGEAFLQWKDYSQTVEDFHTGGIIKGGTVREVSQETIDAYNAPFPDNSYKEAARQFPTLVPVTPNDPSSQVNREAWQKLKKWDKPFLCAFSDSDPIMAGVDKTFIKLVPGTKNMPHTTIEKAGHFLQEDNPEDCVKAILSI
jgi:haloalkane dehalogenase